MRVLVTGGAGFIGTHTLPRLVEAGFEVHATSRARRTASQPGVQWHAGDLLSQDFIEELVRRVRPTHLLHLAAETTHGTYWSSPANLRWLEATVRLARCFADAGGRRLVGLGSCAEYAWGEGVCDEETTPIRPATLYGRTKGQAAEVFRSYPGSAWARLFFVYGPGEQPQRLVPSVISALRRGDVARCTSGGQRRDFVYVVDCATALVRLLAENVEGTFNVGTGSAPSVRDVVTTIATALGAESRVAFGALPERADDPPLLVARVDRLRSLGWSPVYDLRAGIDATLEGTPE